MLEPMPKRARYLLLAASMVAATALACAWRSGIVPALPRWVPQVKEMTVVILLVVQGLAMWPRGFKKQNNTRLLIKPQKMRRGSLALIGGAALLLSALFDGCNPQAASGATQRFCTVVNRPSLEACSAPMVPGAWRRAAAVWNADETARFLERDAPGGGSIVAMLRSSNRRGPCGPGGTNRCPEPATQNDWN